jgi:hypothetical protein
MYDIQRQVIVERTVYLSEDFEARVAEYLQQNPHLTFSGLVQTSLETMLVPIEGFNIPKSIS